MSEVRTRIPFDPDFDQPAEGAKNGGDRDFFHGVPSRVAFGAGLLVAVSIAAVVGFIILLTVAFRTGAV